MLRDFFQENFEFVDLGTYSELYFHLLLLNVALKYVENNRKSPIYMTHTYISTPHIPHPTDFQ